MTRKERIKARKERIAKRNARSKKREEEKKRQKELEETIKIEKSVKTTESLNILIALNCYNYQHRLCWMLSSLVQQKGNVPNLIIDISYTPNNGDPITEDVIKFFREKGLNIKETIVEPDEVKNRSKVRNTQIKKADPDEIDWVIFADCDMVYDPFFFDDLQKQLKGKYAKETKCIGGDRTSLKIEFCSEYFLNDTREYPCEIPNVTDILKEWPVYYIRGKRVAAGYFQLANMESIMKHGGNFSNKERDSLRRYKGDRSFRCQMGGRRGMDVKPQYHLNHTRENPERQR